MDENDVSGRRRCLRAAESIERRRGATIAIGPGVVYVPNAILDVDGRGGGGGQSGISTVFDCVSKRVDPHEADWRGVGKGPVSSHRDTSTLRSGSRERRQRNRVRQR